MKKSNVSNAMVHAVRFIDRAKEWQEVHENETYIYPSKAGGALRRASMELTRALDELRKP